MKKTLFLVSASIILLSCNKTSFTISGTAKGFKDGTSVVLEKQDSLGMSLIPIDTVKIKGEKFEMKGKANELAFYLLQIENVQGKIPFILEGGSINVLVNKDTLHKSKVTGTYNNDEFIKFNKEMDVIRKDLTTFQEKNMESMKVAQEKQDTATINKIMRDYSKIQETVLSSTKAKYLSYAETHPKSFISVLIAEGMIQDPVANIKQIEEIYNKLDKSLKESRQGKSIQKILAAKKMPSVSSGAPAEKKKSEIKTAFSAPNLDGKSISLKECLGKKVTIVDFWASWCGPCRQENPSIVALYNEFKSQGLSIIGVSLDEKKEKWAAAIKKDNLTWTQVSNLKGWEDPIAEQYGVVAIPATFILDASGNVVADRLRGEELKAKVIELLNKK